MTETRKRKCYISKDMTQYEDTILILVLLSFTYFSVLNRGIQNVLQILFHKQNLFEIKETGLFKSTRNLHSPEST